ncbi:fatty acid hydroxylase family protein (plasmid) [Paraburkholderia sp. PREW-6R]|uniref:fatty acid hydroxylase family protein n=1 Tax=Paraburkholderia sp. PREW-6R TaxID=3141544 RepID=UPI0031F55D47
MNASHASPKQAAFQAQYRDAIPVDYSGLRHGAVILAIGAVVLALCIWRIHAPVTAMEWLVVPVVIVGWNLMEWYVHVHFLHKPGNNAVTRALYQRHTLTHHQFFTHEEPRLSGTRDLNIVFFPTFALPGIVVMTAVPALIVGFVWSANAGWLLIASTVAMYLIFEAMHLCAHMPDNAFVRHFPLVATMRRHHIAHHNQQLMMTHNMNFTLPLADWLFNTSDLDRGLIGTIFNGMSEKHVRVTPAKRHKNGVGARSMK